MAPLSTETRPQCSEGASQGSATRRVEAIEQICKASGLRLTPPRRLVLDMLIAHARPLKAYAILESFRKRNPNTAPTSVYRVLQYLVRHRWAVRLHTINAYVAAPLGPAWNCTFLVCERCESVETVDGPALPPGMNCDAGRNFTPASKALEIAGTCSKCKAALEANRPSVRL